MERKRCQRTTKNPLPNRKMKVLIFFDMVKPTIPQMAIIYKNADVVNKYERLKSKPSANICSLVGVCSFVRNRKYKTVMTNGVYMISGETRENVFVEIVIERNRIIEQIPPT